LGNQLPPDPLQWFVVATSQAFYNMISHLGSGNKIYFASMHNMLQNKAFEKCLKVKDELV
jgi:hypothetical protein